MSAWVDVIHALHLKPGDLYAGDVVPESPTRPVHNWHRAHKLTEVSTYRDDGRLMVQPVSTMGDLEPLPCARQVLVIRGTA